MKNSDKNLTFGRFLKFWRKVFSLSQEELAYQLNSSPRHISRLENGSSQPSRIMVLEVAQVLKLGERDTNNLLLAAGLTPDEKKVDFFSDEYKWLRKALILNLRALDPHPAALLDSSTNILMVNKAWVGFYSRSIPMEILKNVKNHHDFLFDRKSAGTLVSDWENTLSAILMTLQQNALFSDRDIDFDMATQFANHANVPENWELKAAKLEPRASFSVQIDIEGTLSKFFSVSNIVGALSPTAYIPEPRLTINTLFPEDENLDLSSLAEHELSHPLLFY